MVIEKIVAVFGTLFGYLVIFAILDVPIDFPSIHQWWRGLYSLFFGIFSGVFIDYLVKKNVMTNWFLSLMIPFIVCATLFYVLILIFTPHVYLGAFIAGTFATSLVLIRAENDDHT